MSPAAAILLFISLLISATSATISIISSTQPGHALIQEACSHAGSDLQHLCISSLSAEPESATADLRMLAIIAVRVAVNNTSQSAAYLAAQQVNSIDAGAKNPMLYQCANDCMELYIDAVDQLDTATAAIDDEADKDALTWLEAAMVDVTSCEKICGAVATVEIKERISGAKKMLNVTHSLAKLLLADREN